MRHHQDFGYSIFVLCIKILSLFEISIAARSKDLGPSGCNPGWVLHDHSCYRLYNDMFAWSQAKHACEAMESHLVTIGSAQENEFVYKSLAKRKTVWIGMYRNPVEFAWVTGERSSYTNWINGNGDDVNEKCTEMTDYSSFHGQWNDNDCDETKQGYICEQDLYITGLFHIQKGVAMNGHVISEPKSLTDIDCVLQCLQSVRCKSVNYYYDGRSTKLCQLNSVSNKDNPEDLVEDNDADYYEKMFD